MDRRSFLLTMTGALAAASALGIQAAAAGPVPANDLGAVRAALVGEPAEMQRRGGGRRGGGFRGGGFRGGGFRGRAFRGGGGWRRRGWGPPGRRRFWGGPPAWGPRRRCWINRWGVWVCRRPRPIWW